MNDTKRSVPEWIGKTPDTAIPKRVKLRVFERHSGQCYISGRKIRPGDAYQFDHVIALCNGGENREDNLAPVLSAPHKVKTASDVNERAKVERIRAKFLGLNAPKPASKWKRTINNGTVLRGET